MPSSYNLETEVGQVRLLISDVGGETGTSFVFTDEEITAFLNQKSGDDMLAAALALRVMAANEVLTQKRIQFLELKTDGPAEAKALNELADKYDEQAEGSNTDFEIAELGVDPFSRRELRGLSG